jgi:hypothetical protein
MGSGVRIPLAAPAIPTGSGRDIFPNNSRWEDRGKTHTAESTQTGLYGLPTGLLIAGDRIWPKLEAVANSGLRSRRGGLAFTFRLSRHSIADLRKAVPRPLKLAPEATSCVLPCPIVEATGRYQEFSDEELEDALLLMMAVM